MTDIKTHTINIDLNKIKVRDTEDRKKWLKLIDKEIRECRKMGIPYSIQNELNAPMNVEKGEDLRSYTVEKSQYAEEKNTNNWTENIHNVTGYLKLGGLIKSGELKGLYYNIIDIDRKSAWDIFLGNDTEEELVRKYPWIEYHKEPYYKRHINLVTVKPIPYVKETTVIDNNGNTLGIGVFSDNTQWVTGIHSINVKSGKLWTLVPNGYKSYKVLSEDEYNDIVERVGRVCRFNKIWDYGTEQEQEQKQEQDKEQKHEQKQDKAKEEEFTDQDQDQEEFDTPTNNFINYIVRCLIPHFNEGLRDKIVFNLSGYLAKEGINIKITKKIIEILQEKHNQKPNLKITKLEKIGSRTQVIINSYKKVKNHEKIEGFSALKPILEDPLLLTEFSDKVEDFVKFYNTESRIQDIYEITALDLMSKYPCLTLQETIESDKPSILVFNNDGYYTKKKPIKQIIHELYPHEFTRYDVNEIVEQIRYKNVVDREDTDTDLHLINVKNGLYNYKTKTLLPHDPQYLSLIQIPIEYDSTKKCPEFNKFINESVSKSDRESLLYALAYIFHRRNDKEIINFLIGEGYNGKSLLILVMKYLLGKENVSNVSLERILNDPYVEASLIGKLVNFAPDTKVLTAEDITKLKIIVGKQDTTIERKYHDSYESALNIKLFFPINRIGHIEDDSDGFHRRPNYITFPQKYKDELTKEEKNDPTQEYKLANTKLEQILNKEKQGIFNLLMEKLDELESRDFRFGRSANQNREKYDLLQNRIPIFVETYIEFREKDYSERRYREYWEYKDTIFAALDKFCKANEVPTPSKDSLSKYLRAEIERRYKNDRNKNGFSFDGKRVRETTGKKEYVYYGLKLLSEEEQERKERIATEDLDLVTCDKCGEKIIASQTEIDKHDKYDCK